jgi:hypothetical protein
MSKKLKIGLVGLLVVAALAVAMTGTALAQEETPTPAPKPFGGHGWGHDFSRGFGGQVGLEAAAEALDMTVDELTSQLWGGETLADLAEEAGVDLQVVRDAVEAAQEQAVRDAIEQAVEDGTLTREHADWLLQGLDNGYWGGHGFGGCGGRGGFGGHGDFDGRSGFSGRGSFGGFRGNSGFGGFGRFPGGNTINSGRSDV